MKMAKWECRISTNLAVAPSRPQRPAKGHDLPSVSIESFPQLRLGAGACPEGEGAPIPVVPGPVIEPRESTLSRPSAFTLGMGLHAPEADLCRSSGNMGKAVTRESAEFFQSAALGNCRNCAFN